MDKKDIVLYSKKIIEILLEKYRNNFSDEVANQLEEYYNTLEKSDEFDDSKSHKLDFLFLSTSFLMNEGLVHRLKLEQLLKGSVAEDIDLDIYNENESDEELVFNNSKDNVSAPAKYLTDEDYSNEEYQIISKKNYIPGAEVSNDLRGFINLVDSLSHLGTPYSIVQHAIEKLVDLYNNDLINRFDNIDEGYFNRFLSTLEDLYYPNNYDFNNDDEEYTEPIEDDSFDDKADYLDKINEEFIEDYDINLFRILKYYAYSYQDYDEVTKQQMDIITKDIEEGTKEEKRKGKKEFDRFTAENSAILGREKIIDPVQLIIFTRNALAHNNYEFVGDDKVRLYRIIVESKDGKAIEPKDLTEEQIEELGGRKTIFNVTMSLNLLKKISDKIEQACHEEYVKQKVSLPVSPNFIYDELYNTEHEKNSVYTADDALFQKNKDKYAFDFLILSLLNANLMVLHNIDLNQTKNNLNFDNMTWDETTELEYLHTLIKGTTGQIKEKEDHKKALLYKPDGEKTQAHKNMIILEKFMKERKELANSVFKNKKVKEIIEEFDIKKLTIDNINLIIRTLEERSVPTKLQENTKFTSVNNGSLRTAVERLTSIKTILEAQQDSTAELKAKLKTYEKAEEDFKNGNKKAIKPFEKGETLTKYILRNSRIALAHGTIKLSRDEKTGEIIVYFTNYDRDDKSIITFNGSMPLNNLLKAIINKEQLDYLTGKSIKENNGLTLK